MHANFDFQLWNWFLVINSYSTVQVCMKFAYIVTGLVFLLSYWISDNVRYICKSLICIYLFSVTLSLISVYHVICEKNKRNTQNSVSKKHSTLSQIIQIDKKVESTKSYFYVVCIYILQSVPYRKEHLNVSSLNLTLFSYQNSPK